MAERNRPSKNKHDGKAPIGPDANGTGKVRAKADRKDKLASRSFNSDRDVPTGSNVKPEAAINLTASEHAQITQAIFEQAQIGVAIVDVDGKVQRVSHALAELLHYGQKELAGRKMDSLIHTPDAKQSSSPWKESGPGKNGTSSAMIHLVRKTGDTIPCLISSQAIRARDGKVTRFLVFIADARSMRDSQKLSQFEHELCRAHSMQTLGMLAAGVAHDFNNALEVIIGFASLARVRLSQSDPLHEPLKIIEESAKGAAGLARQLLEVSKVKPEHEDPVSVKGLVRATLNIITRTFDRKIRVEQRIAPRLPCVKGNRNRLQQAILNLCINARDAMPRGGTLSIEAALQTLEPGDERLPATCAPGNYIRVGVRDTGQGMEAEVLEKIFDHLFTTKGPGEGFGLGLAMVSRIVKEAEGFISVTSNPGGGSEFSLYLPAVYAVLPKAAHTMSKKVVSGRGGVLVVDDEPHVLEFLEKGLTRLGYDVITAEGGSKACEIYSRKSEEIGCVLLDLIMPGMSGLETYSRLKDMNPAVRVILSSGYSSGRFRREAGKFGAPEFLEKPFTLQELSQAMQKVQRN